MLLILAGVSISLIMGNNGILTQAKNSTENYRKATAEEEIAMAWASCETDYWSAWANDSSVTKADFFEGENGIKKYLKGTGEVTSFSYNEGGTSEITYKGNSSADANPGQYIIYADGKVTVASKLSNVVNVGDYVNINVGYTDKMVASTTGWRVLSKNTTTGVVRLISTGHPLTFYYPYVDDSTSGKTSVAELKTIENGSISLQTSSTTRGYQASGFTPSNMSGIFSDSSIFSGVTLTVPADISGIGIDNDLRKTGKSYWLGASSGSKVYFVDFSGLFRYYHSFTLAVRPVVSLVSGVTVKDGDGTSISPYRLNGISY